MTTTTNSNIKIAAAVISAFSAVVISCNSSSTDVAQSAEDSAHSCMQVPSRFGSNTDTSFVHFSGDISVAGMMRIPGGVFQMGGDNSAMNFSNLSGDGFSFSIS